MPTYAVVVSGKPDRNLLCRITKEIRDSLAVDALTVITALSDQDLANHPKLKNQKLKSQNLLLAEVRKALGGKGAYLLEQIYLCSSADEDAAA